MRLPIGQLSRGMKIQMNSSSWTNQVSSDDIIQVLEGFSNSFVFSFLGSTGLWGVSFKSISSLFVGGASGMCWGLHGVEMDNCHCHLRRCRRHRDPGNLAPMAWRWRPSLTAEPSHKSAITHFNIIHSSITINCFALIHRWIKILQQ